MSIDAKLIGISQRFTADGSCKKRMLLIRYSPAMTTAMGTPMTVIEDGLRVVNSREYLWAWAYANFDALTHGETVSEASVLKYRPDVRT